MPAVTLGFEEIEDRLRTVGRRANLFALQHAGYVALSVLALASAALIVAGLRGSPRVFSATLLIALGAILTVFVGAPFVIFRQWRNLQTTAELVDRRGGLQDRMVTLLAVRDRQPPARLASLLMADTLALGRRWEPRVLVPRRIPRSLYALLAALAALSSTLWLSREPPPPTQSVTLAGEGSKSSAARPMAGAQPGEHSPLTQVRPDPGSSVPDDGAQSVSASAAGSAHDQSGLGEGAANSDIGNPQPNSSGNPFGQHLQQLIRQAFNAQAAGKPEQLARRTDHGAPSNGGDRDHADQGGQQASGKNQDRTGAGAAEDAKEGNPHQPGNAQANTANREGNANQPSKTGDHPASDGQTGDPHKGSGAGAGSAGGGLLAAKDGHAAPDGAAPKTFKVTLVSFLQNTSLRSAPEPKAPRGRVSDEGFSPPSHSTATLSEQQLSDDLMRKAEIPVEFEEIVRRVYSQRSEP